MFTETLWLAYEDAVDIDGLNKVAKQGSLVSKHLPLSDLVRGGHADHFRGAVITGWRENWEHLDEKSLASIQVPIQFKHWGIEQLRE